VTTTSGKTEIIAIYWLSGSSGDTVSSVTGPFTGATLISARNNFSGKYTLEIWRASGNGSSGSVAVAFQKANTTFAGFQVIELSGNNTSSPIAQSKTNSAGTGTSATANFTSAPAAGNAELILFGADANVTFTNPSGFNSLDSGSGATPPRGFRTVFNSTAQQNTTSTVSASAGWGSIAIEIAHA
jgi:hypothetical protein